MKKLVLPAAIILLVFTVSALETSITPVKSSANQSSPAVFNVTLQNQNPDNQTYSVSILSPKSSWLYYPKTIKAPGYSNKTFQITASPVEDALQQRYRFDGKIREQKTGKTKQFTGIFNVQQPYKLHIIDLKQEKTSFIPGEIINTEIEVKNLDSQPIENYQVKAAYKNKTKTETGTRILPGGTRRYEFSFRTDKNATPGTNQIEYTVTADNKLQTTAAQKTTIETVKNISETQQTNNKILVFEKTVKAKNTGNSPTNVTLTAETPAYLQSITSTSIKPNQTQEIDGKTVYTWQKTLQPDEQFSATYQVNYWIPVAAITLLILMLAAIKLLGNNISLIKTAETDGNSIKINLEIENNGEKTIEQLELEEFIPDIATVDESFSMNTPKIRKTNEGTKLTWQVEDLEPGDQRIIQYKIRPKVQVEEEVDFQPATIRDTEGKKIAESNTTSAEFNT
ncbi:hypothetical protein [Candidatus Nanohalobium constans]|uniref:DUF11 domain-containing protein n=1 Tax=Candidatus Nanohalobium constans TaxID=2565781 RepID=A0A5Q0UI51_9ARCH|nr:hypothetical protein [Candidatus Nanohalobium constans]QGA80605.1 hypothetical protein LC1Nh_0717 [Candidatus Nanohalobium constans]